jgi:hypothetical protein
VWWYDRNDSGEYVARSPEAPIWSLAAFHAQPVRPGISLDRAARDVLLGDATSAYLYRTPAVAEEVWRLEDERDAARDVFDDLEQRLLEQQRSEWRAYGRALTERIEAAAARLPGRSVPVHVTIDIETVRAPHEQPPAGYGHTLEAQLVEAAVLDTPTPDDLPGTPLSRLQR